MAYKKSPGPNGIPTETFKNLDSYGMLLLHEIILRYWTNNQYNPEAYTRLGLCILPKTGDLSNPNKWHSIALGNIIAKLISSTMWMLVWKRKRHFYIHTKIITTDDTRTPNGGSRTIFRPYKSI
jgi:hypothetical protein